MESHIVILLLSGGLIASVVGYLSATTAFCQSGAIYDMVMVGNKLRLKAWGLAALSVVVVIAAAEAVGGFDLSGIARRSTTLPVGRLIIGGLIFGVGMALARGCPTRLIVRAGRGQLSGMLGILVVALSATIFYSQTDNMQTIIQKTSVLLPVSQDLAVLISHGSVQNDRIIRIALLFMALSSAVVLYAHLGWKNIEARGALIIGLATAAVWLLTASVVGENARDVAAFSDPMHKGLHIRSMSFVGPSISLMNWVKAGFVSHELTLGLALLMGVFFGALFVQFKYGWRFINDLFWLPLHRQIIGFMAMGIGGVLALGCTFGQGISGIGVLSLGSVLALSAMLSGAMLTHKIEKIINFKNL